MATINCPHCGKEMFEELTTCPHCGGPVFSEASQKKYTEGLEEINQSEKKWLIGTTIAGIVFTVVFLGKVFTDSEIFEAIFGFTFCSYVYAAWFYACHYFHPIRRFREYGFISLIIIGGLFIACVYSFAGVFFIYPRALLRLILKKPLLTESYILNCPD